VAHPDANIIFGAVIDDSLGDECRVTVIAAGFDKLGAARPSVAFQMERGSELHEEEEEESIPLPSLLQEPEEDEDLFRAAPATVILNGDDDDLDIPDFLKDKS
jgi:cell division protein FtsZ